MQTAKIKIGDTYAFYRNGKLARFVVQALVNTKTKTKSVNVIKGYVEEDRTEGQPVPQSAMNPEDLLGPYEEQAELVARKAEEDAARKAKEAEKTRLAELDRLALYAFVGQRPPKDVDDYDQPFRVRWGTLNVDESGVKLIVAKVRALQEETRGMEPQSITTEHSPELLAAAEAQWKAEGKV